TKLGAQIDARIEKDLNILSQKIEAPNIIEKPEEDREKIRNLKEVVESTFVYRASQHQDELRTELDESSDKLDKKIISDLKKERQLNAEIKLVDEEIKRLSGIMKAPETLASPSTYIREIEDLRTKNAAILKDAENIPETRRQSFLDSKQKFDEDLDTL